MIQHVLGSGEVRHMSMRFDIHPYVGALPITFGMTREQVYRFLGPPESSHATWDGSGVSEHYNRARYNIAYTNGGAVNHLGFSPGGAELAILGQPIWTVDEHPDPNPILLGLDSDPMAFVGFWFFLAIGVTSTGYHDDDPTQWAVTVFPYGSTDAVLTDATPADTSRYRRG